MKTSTIVSVLVAILVIGAAGYWYTTIEQPAQSPNTTTTTNDNPNGADYSPNGGTSSGGGTGVNADINAGVTTGSIPTSATVIYSASGFSPASVTIKKGGTVTFINQGGGPMSVASNQHPSHSVYDGTSRAQHCAVGYTGAAPFDQCSVGTSFSFTFTKVGVWGYHNHMGTQDTGTVTVVE
jgi:plastocyanin